MNKSHLLRFYFLSIKNHIKLHGKDLTVVSLMLAFLLNSLHQYLTSHSLIPSLLNDTLGSLGIIIIIGGLRKMLHWDKTYLDLTLNQGSNQSIFSLKRAIWTGTSFILSIPLITWFSLNILNVIGLIFTLSLIRLILSKIRANLPLRIHVNPYSLEFQNFPSKWNPVLRSFALLHLARLTRINRWTLGIAILLLIPIILVSIELQRQFRASEALYFALTIPFLVCLKDLAENFPESHFYQNSTRSWKVSYLLVRAIYNSIIMLPILFFYILVGVLRIPDFSTEQAFLCLPLAGLIAILITSLSNYMRMIAPSSQLVRVLFFTAIAGLPPVIIIFLWRERSLKKNA